MSSGRNLTLATISFAGTFWAWNLIGPLAPSYAKELHLTPFQTSLIVATPVLVGSLGRIPVGALTDRYGGRLMLTVITFLSIIPVLFVGLFTSFATLLIGGFFLGIAGTSFAVGVPFVNGWYEPSRRGFATGLFGAGMGGTALSAFITPRLADAIGRTPAYIAVAIGLAIMGVVVYLLARNAPSWSPSREPIVPRLREALAIGQTWKMAGLYALAFGGFVAFSTYLPIFLQNVYEFAQSGAGLRTAGFSIAAVVGRPLGGMLSDRIGPRTVLVVSFAATCVLALVVATRPPVELAAGLTFVALAFALGLGMGGVFALLAKVVEPSRVGTVTGLVGAAGGLGGYFPPLLMGAVYGMTGSYAIGLVLLAATALAAMIFVWATYGQATVGPRGTHPGPAPV